MQQITVDEVYEKVRDVLKRRATKTKALPVLVTGN
jgi:phage gp16-like protein